MTGKSKSARAALDRLAKALVDDVLNAPDEEILKEFLETGDNSARYADDMRARFEKTLIATNKRRLAAAKAGAAAAAQRTAPWPTADIGKARAQLRAVLAVPGVRQKLTLAARKESEMSDADIFSMLEDLHGLGVLIPESDERGKT